MEPKQFTCTKNGVRVMGAVSLLGLLAAGEARAQSIWTHVASACAVDEGSAGTYEVNAARFKVKNGVTLPATVVARCNVTNPQDSGLPPGWNWMEVTYRDPDGTGTASQVRALLYRVSNATGGVSLLATFDSDTEPNLLGEDKTAGVEFAGSLDFENYAYFVEIRVKRSNSTQDPTISIVRLMYPPI